MSIEDRIQSLGYHLFDASDQYGEEAGWIDKLFSLTTSDETFRLQSLKDRSLWYWPDIRLAVQS